MIILNLIISIFIIVLCGFSSLVTGGMSFIQNNISPMEQKIIIDNLSTKDGLIENYKTSINGIQLLNSFPHDIILDIRYASKNNFTKKVLYDAAIALIHEETLKKLLNAQEEFKSLGYKIKLWDAYRPFYIQKILWDIVPNNNYIATIQYKLEKIHV